MRDDTQRGSEFRVLLQQANRGDADAFGVLARVASVRLRRLCKAMLRNYPHVHRWDDTDDVLQTTLIRLHAALKDVRPESTSQFFGLAATLMRRALIDLGRHYYGVLGMGANHASRGGGRAADDPGGAVAEATGLAERPCSLEAWTAFHEAVEALPDQQREVFSLIWYGGLKRDEVARTLGVCSKTVTRRMTRARLRLHEQLAGNSVLAAQAR